MGNGTRKRLANQRAVERHQEREAAIWSIMERMQAAIAQEIRVMLGEQPVTTITASVANSEQMRRIEALKKCAAESTTAEERHASWMAMHVESGWVYGETFDPVAKTHPNLVPWDQLPATAKSKANIFDIVAHAAAKIIGEIR